MVPLASWFCRVNLQWLLAWLWLMLLAVTAACPASPCGLPLSITSHSDLHSSKGANQDEKQARMHAFRRANGLGTLSHGSRGLEVPVHLPSHFAVGPPLSLCLSVYQAKHARSSAVEVEPARKGPQNVDYGNSSTRAISGLLEPGTCPGLAAADVGAWVGGHPFRLGLPLLTPEGAVVSLSLPDTRVLSKRNSWQELAPD